MFAVISSGVLFQHYTMLLDSIIHRESEGVDFICNAYVSFASSRRRPAPPASLRIPSQAEERISDGSETYLAYIVYGRTIFGKSSDFFGIDHVGTLREACVDTPLLAESVGQPWPLLAAFESSEGAQGQVRWSNSWRDCYSRDPGCLRPGSTHYCQFCAWDCVC